MKLTFLGTGTSQGIPIIGCDCPVCCSENPHNRRTRTSALLHTNQQNILIDVGPDFRNQALATGLRQLDAVLLTHHHFDHIAGIDDLRPLTDRQGTIPIYGYPDTLEYVRQMFAYAFGGEANRGSSRPLLELIPVTGPFSIGPLHILPMDIMHGDLVITAYRIGEIGYVTDASAIPSDSMQKLQNLDTLVLNALRYKPHPTHFSLEEALSVIADLRPRRAFLVHMTHTLDHASVNAQLPANVQLAYDGLTLEIEDTC